MDLGGVSLSELRRRYLQGAAAVPPRVIAGLARDPRAGARALSSRLARMRQAERWERRRLAALSALERRLHRQGIERIAGVDEVGMGPLAGPVVAAAVVLPARSTLPGLDDSKRLTAELRTRLDVEIRKIAVAIGVGWADPAEIDQLNIFQAGLVAMRRAVEALPEPADRLVVDGRAVPGVRVPQDRVVGGDGRVAAIAAASIVAKVYRDSWMRDLDARYPGYGFGRNAGYATPEHLRALALLGPCPAHRTSYAPVRGAGPMGSRA